MKTGRNKGKSNLNVLDHLLQTADLSATTRAEVLQRMSTPERHYHGLGHLGALWSRHRKYAHGTEYASAPAARLIACAIAFHDLVYDPARDDNEMRSAALWRRSVPSGLTDCQSRWVADAIEATAHHLSVTDDSTASARLRLWLLDLDLTPLGEPSTVFARHTQALRREYTHLSDRQWESRRIGFLRQIRAAPQIYRCPPLALAFEQQARANIACELARVA